MPTKINSVPGVAIAMISPGLIVHETTESLVQILSSTNEYRPKAVMLKRSGALIQWARNEVTQEFLDQTDCEWLLWIDSDIQFPPDLIKKLLETADESGAQVVGGMYIHPMNERMKPSVFYYRDKPGSGPSMDAVHMEDVKSWVAQGQKWVYCDGTGAGCLMIHRDALLQIQQEAMARNDGEHWFTIRVIQNVFYGEDLAFCTRVRQLGMKLAVRLDLELGHVKQIVYKAHSTTVA